MLTGTRKNKNILKSGPTRDPWIEIKVAVELTEASPGRVPHGTRGLEFLNYARAYKAASRVPHGTRGLK